MALRDEKRKRVMRALFVNLESWITDALTIADSDRPRSLALHHAHNLMQCRAALARLVDPDDLPPDHEPAPQAAAPSPPDRSPGRAACSGLMPRPHSDRYIER
jgi:hypothetical protein